MKFDPYNFKDKYLAWKNGEQNDLNGLSAENVEILKQYLYDMEHGLNIGNHNKKGARSYSRLQSLKFRIIFLMKHFQDRYSLENLTKVDEEKAHVLFVEMRQGTIRKKDGGQFICVKDYVRDFKAFWHWHQKVSHKKGIELQDITTDLDTSGEKPKWVYLTEEQIKLLAEKSKYDYKVLIYFLFDTGIRAPTELMNVRVSDFFNNFRELNIRQEISKTFGRRIKLMLSSELIKEYIKISGLKENDYLFTKTHSPVNRYLKRASERLFGDKESPAGAKYSDLTMYDFRHCSCCYWLPRYKSESALKYRFGWKKSDKIHYYSELLGMSDTISEEDMLLDLTKTEIEKRLCISEKEKDILTDEVKDLRMQIAQIGQLTRELYKEIKPKIEIIQIGK
ncbi:MAG: hypothetical protein AABX11_03450 [Nanoarchaeota archaeon]